MGPVAKEVASRISRVRTWSDIPKRDPVEGALLTYLKLRQAGYPELRLRSTGSYMWCEVKDGGTWWLVDLRALREPELGPPVQSITHARDLRYRNLKRSFTDPAEYAQAHERSLPMTYDEYRILAQTLPPL